MLKRSEKGSVVIEGAIILPVSIAMLLFVFDFYNYSRSFTYLNLATRDAGIYLALASGTLDSVTLNNLQNQNNQIEACSNDPQITNCPAYIAHERAWNMLSGMNSAFDLNQLTITTSYDGAKVTLSCSAPIKTTFFFNNNFITSSAVLRRIGT